MKIKYRRVVYFNISRYRKKYIKFVVDDGR